MLHKLRQPRLELRQLRIESMWFTLFNRIYQWSMVFCAISFRTWSFCTFNRLCKRPAPPQALCQCGLPGLRAATENQELVPQPAPIGMAHPRLQPAEHMLPGRGASNELSLQEGASAQCIGCLDGERTTPSSSCNYLRKMRFMNLCQKANSHNASHCATLIHSKSHPQTFVGSQNVLIDDFP